MLHPGGASAVTGSHLSDTAKTASRMTPLMNSGITVGDSVDPGCRGR